MKDEFNEILIQKFSEWEKSSQGIALGWQGWAWVWLQLCESGILKDDTGKVFDKILKKLNQEAKVGPLDDVISHVAGFGSLPLICALISKNDPSEKKIFTTLIKSWEAQCQQTQQNDFAFGFAGAMLASAEIETHLPGQIPLSLLNCIWNGLLRSVKSILNQPTNQYLGYSHGIAGYLFAVETGRYVFGLKSPQDLTDNLDHLLWTNRINSQWPERVGELKIGIHGWCHGGPGITMGYLGCYMLTNKSSYKDHLFQAIEGSESKVSKHNVFCCGKIGHSQIMLESFQQLNETRFFTSAKKLQKKCHAQKPSNNQFINSLFFGRLGHIYMDLRMKYPHRLPMPGFGIFSNITASRDWIKFFRNN